MTGVETTQTATPLRYLVDVKPVPRRVPRTPAPVREQPPEPTHIQRMLTLAHVIDDLIRTGKLKNHADAARWLGVTDARVSQITKLSLLAPTIQDAILQRTPDALAPLGERNLRPIAALEVWEGQIDAWKAACRRSSGQAGAAPGTLEVR